MDTVPAYRVLSTLYIKIHTALMPIHPDMLRICETGYYETRAY